MSKVTLWKQGQGRPQEITLDGEGVTVATLVAVAGAHFNSDGHDVFVNGAPVNNPEETVVEDGDRVTMTKDVKGAS